LVTFHLPQALGIRPQTSPESLTQEYPVRPPRVEVLGSTVTHPNVFSTFICLDMLEGGEWASDEELLDFVGEMDGVGCFFDFIL